VLLRARIIESKMLNLTRLWMGYPSHFYELHFDGVRSIVKLDFPLLFLEIVNLVSQREGP
jgi:hypothetical protein